MFSGSDPLKSNDLRKSISEAKQNVTNLSLSVKHKLSAKHNLSHERTRSARLDITNACDTLTENKILTGCKIFASFYCDSA